MKNKSRIPICLSLLLSFFLILYFFSLLARFLFPFRFMSCVSNENEGERKEESEWKEKESEGLNNFSLLYLFSVIYTPLFLSLLSLPFFESRFLRDKSQHSPEVSSSRTVLSFRFLSGREESEKTSW